MEEADFFYMPLYVNLLVWPVFGWADGPWWGAVWGARCRRLPAYVAWAPAALYLQHCVQLRV